VKLDLRLCVTDPVLVASFSEFVLGVAAFYNFLSTSFGTSVEVKNV